MIRACCILLLIILLLQAGGLLLFNKVQLCYHQYEMQQILDNNRSDFQRITLSLLDYQSCKVSKSEVSLNGKMYDVKSVTILNNRVELLVLHDNKEDGIIKKINDFLKQSPGPKNELPGKLQQLLSLNYLVYGSAQAIFTPLSSILTFHFDKQALVSNDAVIFSPPPEFS